MKKISFLLALFMICLCLLTGFACDKSNTENAKDFFVDIVGDEYPKKHVSRANEYLLRTGFSYVINVEYRSFKKTTKTDSVVYSKFVTLKTFEFSEVIFEYDEELFLVEECFDKTKGTAIITAIKICDDSDFTITCVFDGYQYSKTYCFLVRD